MRRLAILLDEMPNEWRHATVVRHRGEEAERLAPERLRPVRVEQEITLPTAGPGGE